MTHKSLFSRLSDALLKSDERSIEDIDREVEASIKDIQATELKSVEAKAILDRSSDETGDTFFIVDLAPIYSVIGDRNSRVATGVEEICHRIFERRSQSHADRGNIEGDYFLMLFADTNNEANFLRAAHIVNEIGTLVLSERFKALDVTDHIVAVPVDDIVNHNGSIDVAKMDQCIAQGGSPVTMKAPDKAAPQWIRLLHEKKQRDFELVKIEHAHNEEKTKWQYAKPEGEHHLKPRNSRDRRHASKAHPGANRRKSFDRRGRGY